MKFVAEGVSSAIPPIATSIQGWNKGSVGIWVGIVMGVIYGLPKFITAMRKLAYDRGDSLDDERRADMDALRAEMKTTREDIAAIRREAEDANHKANEADRRANRAESQANDAEQRLSTAITVIGMLSARVRQEWPNDPLLAGIAPLIEAARSSDRFYNTGLSNIPTAINARKNDTPKPD